jgi:hypothetical protein
MGVVRKIGRGAISATMVSFYSKFRWRFVVPSQDSLAGMAAGVNNAGAPDFLLFLRENEGRHHSLDWHLSATRSSCNKMVELLELILKCKKSALSELPMHSSSVSICTIIKNAQ